MDSSFTVMIIDDEEQVLNIINSALRSGGIKDTICIKDSREVTKILSTKQIGVMLLDLTMPHLSGEELIPVILEDYPDMQIIVITGNTDVSTAVDCMKLGAADYLTKPVEINKLIATVKRILEIVELKKENTGLRNHFISSGLEHPDAFREIITNNEKMYSIFKYIEAIAETNQAVLITGETGVGKELIAGAIHNLSGRKGEFVAVNIAGFDENILADTIFGHKKGAFTGADQMRRGLIERASKGTFFFDEIGDLSFTSQIKFLRLLEENEYFPLGSDVPRRSEIRIIVATNADLDKAMLSNAFRKDLFYRLRTHHIHLPPLRERKGDIPLLINDFLSKAAEDLGKKKPFCPVELYTLLNTYSFPGNIRELKSIIYNAVSEHESGILSLNSFIKSINNKKVSVNKREINISSLERLPTIKKVTKMLIDEALERSKGNQSIAAQLLGISHQALNKRLKRKEEADG